MYLEDVDSPFIQNIYSLYQLKLENVGPVIVTQIIDRGANGLGNQISLICALGEC